MKVEIFPTKGLKGEISIPGDKSISHRAIIFGALAQGTTSLKNFLMAKDCISTINIFRKMGIDVEILADDRVLVEGRGLRGLSAPYDILDAGNSGTTARLLMGLLTGQKFDSTLTGDESLKARPMDRVTIPLRKMGADFNVGKKGDFLPLTIKGLGTRTLRAIDYTLPMASAQVKSALILASLYADDSTTIRQPSPTRDHTEIMLRAFGGNLDIDGDNITTYPNPQLYGQNLAIPGDISSAAYFITAALLMPKSELILKDIGINPTRSGILDVYREMGAKITLERRDSDHGEPTANIIVESSSLVCTVIEGPIIPKLIDELPIIALAATQAEGTTIIRDAQELKVKESDRIDSTVNILKSFGANIEATSDGMIIQGPTPLFGIDIEPGSDHRAIMMTAVAALISKGPTTIRGAQWAQISYPDFFSQMEKLRS